MSHELSHAGRSNSRSNRRVSANTPGCVADTVMFQVEHGKNNGMRGAEKGICDTWPAEHRSTADRAAFRQLFRL